MDLDFIESAAPISLVPREHLKSSTVEALISQNEELMSKLKTAFRRLAKFEETNQRLVDDQAELCRQNSMLHDQVAILKEKDSAWKKKFQHVEEERIFLAEKSIHLEQQVEKQSSEIQRHEKYHEKIKTQVKPYIQQLKKYSQDIEKQQIITQNSVEQKEAQIRDLRYQIVELAKNSRIQAEDQEVRLMATVESYEKTMEELHSEVTLLRSQFMEAETRIVKYHRIQEKFDRLENEMIEVQRSRENIKSQLEKEVLRLQNLQNETHREKSQFEIEAQDLKAQLTQKTTEAQSLQQNKFELTQQLESLRYLFGQKSQENEKAKATLFSLEKLNLELSQKIHTIRVESETEAPEASI